MISPIEAEGKPVEFVDLGGGAATPRQYALYIHEAIDFQKAPAPNLDDRHWRRPEGRGDTVAVTVDLCVRRRKYGPFWTLDDPDDEEFM
jgi:hypothetical protein